MPYIFQSAELSKIKEGLGVEEIKLKISLIPAQPGDSQEVANLDKILPKLLTRSRQPNGKQTKPGKQ